jgi:hypothetical protein
MLGSLAFALPSVGYGIWGRTVFALAAGDTVDTGIYQGWGPGWGGPGPRMGLDVWFSNDKAEFKISPRWQGANTSDLSFFNMYGDVKFVPDLLTVYIGKMSGDGFDNFRKNTPHPCNDMHNSNIGRLDGWGIVIAVAPKDTGFEVAAQWRTPDPEMNYSGEERNWKLNDSIHFRTDWDIAGMLNNASIEASYKMTDVMKISLGFVLLPSADGGALYPAQTSRNIYGRFELLIDPNLTAWADVRYWGLESSTTNINSIICVAYRMGDLFIVLGGQIGYASTGDVLSYKVAPAVEYKLGELTLGLYADLTGDSVANSGMGISLEPYIALYNFAGFIVGFDYKMSTATGATNYWAIPLIFTFSFW